MGKKHVIGAVLAFVIGAGVPASAEATVTATAGIHWGPVESGGGTLRPYQG